ncbi:AEC family transporter [Acidaminobacterium chupaoyuni]
MSIVNAFNGVFALMLLMMLGFFMTRKKFLTEDYYHFLNTFIMKYTVPAFLFENAIKNVTWEFITQSGTMLLAPFITQLGGYFIALGVSKLMKIPRSLQGIFISIFAMCNTMLMGFPICMQIFGEISVPYVTAYYIANTLVFWILVAPKIAAGGELGGEISLKEKIKRVFSPPLTAFICGTAVNLIGIPVPKFIQTALTDFGALTSPIAMLICGYLLASMGKDVFKTPKAILVAVGARLIWSPIFCALICLGLKVPALPACVFCVQAAMPAMNQTVILSGLYKADDHAAAQGLALSNILSVLIIPFTVYFLNMVFPF